MEIILGVSSLWPPFSRYRFKFHYILLMFILDHVIGPNGWCIWELVIQERVFNTSITRCTLENESYEKSQEYLRENSHRIYANIFLEQTLIGFINTLLILNKVSRFLVHLIINPRLVCLRSVVQNLCKSQGLV